MNETDAGTPPSAASSTSTQQAPVYDDGQLVSLDQGALTDLLIRDEDRAPRSLIDECARRADAMVEHFASLIDRDRYWAEEGEYSATWLPLHAAMILGLVPTESAGRLLVTLMRRMDEAQYLDLQDWLSGYWPAFFRNKPETIGPALHELAQDRGLDWYTRMQAAEAFIAAAERAGTAVLEPALDWAAGIAADETEDWDQRLSMGDILLDFPRARHRTLLESLADRQRRSERHFSRGEITEAYAALRDDPQWRRFEDPWKFYQPEAIAERQRQWAREEAEGYDADDDDPFGEPEVPYVRPTQKIGRNDPCPCGSGKKYKKCCLADMEG